MRWKDFSFCMFYIFVMAFCFGMGFKYAKTEYKYKLDSAQTRLQNCENMWKLDVNLFYPELCKTVCVEEFEKMAC